MGSWRLEAGGQRPEARGWKLEVGGWQPEAGGQRLAGEGGQTYIHTYGSTESSPYHTAIFGLVARSFTSERERESYFLKKVSPKWFSNFSLFFSIVRQISLKGACTHRKRLYYDPIIHF